MNKAVMINRMPRALKTIIAPKYFTTMTATLGAVLGTTATQSQNFQVSGSTIYLPFYDGDEITSMTGCTLATGTPVLTDNNVVGFRNLREIYTRYRVHASMIRVTFSPTSILDTTEFVVVPCNFDITSASAIIPNSFDSAKGQPYSKFRTCQSTNPEKQNTIISKIKNRTILGLTKEQYRSDLDTSYSINDTTPVASGLPGMPITWLVWYRKYATGTYTSAVNISVSVRYYVEWFQPQQDFRGGDPPPP